MNFYSRASVGLEDRSGLVARSRLRGQMVPGLNPNSVEDPPYYLSIMDFILKLKEERKAFSDDLDPKYILSSLHRFEVITAEEYERIKSKTTKHERFNELFSLLTNGSKTFSQLKFFIGALEEEDEEGCLPYPWLAEKLKPALKLDDDVHKILVRGNVPLPVNHLLPQEKKMQNIRDKLIEASYPENQSNWVVLHGPFGSGKSSLAAEALRVNYLINDYFSDGVYWLDFGGNKISSANKLEINNYDKKIENILKLLNSNYIFSPDDDLTYLLRNEILSKPKVLFILVDVCDKRIIEAFNIGCPILVTTTMKNIMDDVSSYCAFIECSNDVENGDIKLLLSKYVNCKVEELPNVVQDICSKCGGSLLVASLIGGDMAYVGNDEETWKDWNKKLQENGLAGLKKIREKDVFNVIVNCIENNNEWKEYYCDLVIFKKGFDVPSEVLQIMWNSPAVFKIALELYKRSFIVIKESESGSKFFCCSHDLYVDAVSEYLGKEEIKKLHKKFVQKILWIDRLPGEAFDLTKLPKHYIPSFIDYHLYQAGELKVLEELYLDLKFIEQKIRLMNDCRSILVDYQCYKNCFENKEDAESFELFVQRKGKYLLREEKCDIIQLALFEPSNSIVYKKAREYANKNKGIYYDWCNKTENIHEFFDYKTRSCSNAKFGAINQDASLVALGFKPEEDGSEETSWMKVWHLPTANEFVDKNSHGDVINYCAFSSAGDYLATASADTTVKIFKIRASIPTKEKSFQDSELGKLIFTFDRHKDEVVCCSFSSDDRYVISSDIIGKTLVWKFDVHGDYPSRSIVILNLSHSHNLKKEPLRFSSFSNDGKTIGTAVYDTVKLWDFKTEEEKTKICCKDNIIRKFIFTNDDSRILLVQDFAILFWTIENDNMQTIFSDNSCAISSCCLSSSGQIACGMKSGHIIIITKDSQKILPGHNDEILNVMFSKDESKLFSVSSTRCITQNVSVIETAPLINGCLSVVMGNELIIASARSSYSIEIRKGEMVAELNLEDKISTFALCNDGSEIVIGTVHGSVKVFNIIEKHSVELLPKHSGKITYILHSKNNHSFFTCSVDATINVWHKKEHHVTLPGHKLPVVMCVEFKLSNKLLSWCEDGSLKVWNTDSGECIRTLEVPRGENITCCDVSCDDKYVAAALTSRNIMVWTAKNGNLYKEFPLNHNVRCCQFSNRTEMLIAGLDNGNIVMCHLYDGEIWYLPESKRESAVSSIRKINEDDRSDELYFLSASKSIKLWNRFGHLQQTILFPNSTMADECPQIWASDNFDIFVVTLNSILYKLRRIYKSQEIN
ncbi:Apoptotic protease-activating factor 1 [Araneus ventricosus]|uniref:Apoptotic protease-activating factor 1 n=1 Tax=Araneus ventricosus TaxID=182803 RepID=A0A4Y2FY25_ARAVE|nr:Apoptotic protease-activating factor 1 [Araneus ventricosus]